MLKRNIANGWRMPGTNNYPGDRIFPPSKHWKVLIDHINKHHWTSGAEIGVFKGACLFRLLENCRNLKMIGVDQWKNLPSSNVDGSETYGRYDMPVIGLDVLARAKQYGPRCIILQGDTVAMAANVPNRSLDFVFIDATHTYDGVMRDLNAWIPKVRDTGMVMGHDHNWPSVAQALTERVPGWGALSDFVWRIPKAACAK
jgi:hypothetical protein